jgi:ACR3 family arsenite efflux pump ArsB
LAAAAILMFGFQSGAALATVVCGLIDVQAMRTIVSVENCKGGYEGRPIDGQSVM